jgi:hypothetical protein
MNRWKMRGVAALAVIALAAAGCQNQGTDPSQSIDTMPSMEESMGTESMAPGSDGMTESMDASPSEEASPSDS